MIDPMGDRVMKNVPPISRYPLTRDKLWHISSKNYGQFVVRNTNSATGLRYKGVAKTENRRKWDVPNDIFDHSNS